MEWMAFQSLTKEFVFHREQFELWRRWKIKPGEKKNDFVTSMLNHIVKSELPSYMKKQLIDSLKNYTHLY